eukprot:1029599-Pleurochrysis_carterae.AAC.1
MHCGHIRNQSTDERQIRGRFYWNKHLLRCAASPSEVYANGIIRKLLWIFIEQKALNDIYNV